MKTNKINVLKRCLFLAFIIIAITIVISIVIKYHVEGETTLPYYIKQIRIVSNVGSKNNEDTENLWNVELSENNYIFIDIAKSSTSNNDTIKDIKMDNFTITTPSEKGNIIIYRPTGDFVSGNPEKLYEYSEQNYLDSDITYTGAKVDTLKTLEIGNEGGMLGFKIALEDLGNYVSNNYDEVITYDGTLLTKAGISQEDITFSISFDLTITLNSSVTFKGTLNLDLPSGDLINEREAYTELTNFDDIVFKRQ
jgi:hypothetical protein